MVGGPTMMQYQSIFQEQKKQIESLTFSQQLSEEEISSLYQEKIELYALIKTISNQLEKMKTEETFSKKDQTALDNLRKAISIDIVGERE